MDKITWYPILFIALFVSSMNLQAQCTSNSYNEVVCKQFTISSETFLDSSPQSSEYNAATAGDTYYIRSNTGNPWGNTGNQAAMDAAFGPGNWTEVFFETLDPSVVFAPTSRFAFIEGSDNLADDLNIFLTANLTTIESWVAGGGVVLINAAPNTGTDINFGFGGSTLNYNGGSTGATNVEALIPTHPAFLGPNTPTTTSMTGSSYSHAFVSGTGLTAVLGESGNLPETMLVEKSFGDGHVMLGGMTTLNWHSPVIAATNFRINLLVYLESLAVSPGPINECGPSVPLVDSGTAQSAATVTQIGIIGTDYDIDSIEINLNHTFDGDLDISLISPAGTVMLLSGGNGGGANDYINTVFANGGGVCIEAGAPPFTGTFEPEGGLTVNAEGDCTTNNVFATVFDGESITGNWTLNVLDNFGGDTGTLNSYCINFTPSIDPNAPIMNCPGDVTLDASPGACDAPYGFGTPVALDPEGGSVTVSQTMGAASPGPYPVGTTIIEFTATNDDAPNETTVCQFTITVVDNQPPMMTCPDDVSQTNDSGLCEAAVTVLQPTIVDNCPTNPAGLINDYNGTDNASDVYPVGTTVVTWTYTDAGGNSATCTMEVTVTDDEAPEVVCVGGAMPASGATSASPGLAIPDGDPAGITTTMDVTDDFDITDLNVDIDISHTWVGDLTVSLTAPDGVTTAVLIDRPGYTGTGFGCDGTDIQATLDDEAATPVEDECGGGVPTIAGSFIPNEALSVFDGMSTVGTWTLFLSDSATPDPGVLNSWSLNYDYLATTSPPLEVFLDEDGMALVPASMFVSMATDNCSIATIEVVDGVNLPTIDQCGDNVGGAISSTLPPTESVTNVAEAGVIGADYTLDNVEIDITHTFDGDLEIELISPAGTPLMLSDNNGGSGNDFIDTVFMDGGADINTGSAPFTGTFEPEGGTFAATFDGEAITGDWTLRVTDTFGGDDGTLDSFCISFVPINPSQALFTCDDVGNTTVDIIVTDIGGNTAMCTASVLVIDNIDPILVCQDFTLELGPDGTAMLDPMDLIDMTNTIEACGISVDAVSEDDFDCDDIGTPQMITLFVSDPSGNLASCVATVTVVDLLGPEVTCPADMTIDPGANNQLYEVPDYFADGLASATDNCTDPVTVFAQDPAAGSFLGDGVYTVTLSAFDEYGNEGTCTFELTIESILGAADNTLDAGVTLYPNPAQNQVILSNASNILLTKATMYDVNGKLVSTIDLSNMTTEKTIDISQLASGVYIVQIEGDNASVVKRLIKE